MATVEEQLVGYQVVRALNRAQRATLDLAGRLQTAKDDKEAAEIVTSGQRIMDMTETELGKVSTFISGYPGGVAALAKSYLAVDVNPKQVADELTNLTTVKDSAKQALSQASGNTSDAASIGAQIHAEVEGHITEIMDDEIHFEPIQMQVVVWDLVNVIAMCLQGINHGNGKPMDNDSVETRRNAVARHLKTFGRCRKYLDDSEDSLKYEDAVDAIQMVLTNTGPKITTEQMTSLGEMLDAMVPRIPLLRRAWQYSGQVERNHTRP